LPGANGGSVRDQPDSSVPAQARWADLRLRFASAIVLGPMALLCLWFGGLVWIALVAALTAGLAREWLRFRRRLGPVASVAGLAWIGASGAGLAWLRDDPAAGLANVTFLVLAVWSTDIGAYLAGRTIGGPRLAPNWSPAKTWAGAAGGLAAAGLAGAAVAAGFGRGHPAAAAVLAMAASVAAQAGDLAESAMKRRLGVKDTGGLIPGHGGLLDRLDGMLAAAVPASLLALAMGRGIVFWQ
jgi:phosphatidate cytidylyltransferase